MRSTAMITLKSSMSKALRNPNPLRTSPVVPSIFSCFASSIDITTQVSGDHRRQDARPLLPK